ncbi:MAG: hypothetical protein KIH69_005450, partial [Anaerolineae bacterium]|nr:hypothetical protein [Anaerolineae bacterium]
MTDWLKHNTRPTALAAAVTIAAALILWAGATPPSDILRFAAYELGFVLLPGGLVYRALRPTQSRIRQIAFGWAIGYTLEIFAFCLTAILNLRPLFMLYPLLSIFLYVRTKSQEPRVKNQEPRVKNQEPRTKSQESRVKNQESRVKNQESRVKNQESRVKNQESRVKNQESRVKNQTPVLNPQSLILPFLIILSLIYLGLSYFSETPLKFAAVTHHPDLIWQIGNAAEALRHVPLTDPRVAGEPLNYHNFVYYHMAAVSQVTGIELSTILFRLYLVPIFIALGLQLHVLGIWASGKAWAGPLAVALFFFFGELGWQNTSANPYAFLNTLFTILWLSPTYTLGLVIFIPLIVEAFKNQEPRTKNQDVSAKNEDISIPTTNEKQEKANQNTFSTCPPQPAPCN